MTGMWRTDAMFSAEKMRAQMTTLNVLSAELDRLGEHIGHDLTFKDLVVWLDGVEWRWEPMGDRLYGVPA